MTPDPYAILGVEPSADAADIRAAYVMLLREFHPDRNLTPEAAERTQGIIAAFKVLSNLDHRSRYDWDRRRDREAVEAAAAPRPVNSTAIAAMAMAILALGGLLLKPGRADEPPPVRHVTTSAPTPATAQMRTSRPDSLEPVLDRKLIRRRSTDTRE